ncbi:MAG TPA: RDD family protein [Candidatus Saccharimonadales bacterium]|nr:RDD family protein [Candidatus Saccharimonadales bacterium]
MFCSKCGSAIANNSSFCQTCGTPVNPAAALAPASASAVAVSPHAGVGAIVYASNVAYAGFWLRFVAHLIDGVIVGFGMLVLLVPIFFLMGGAAMIESLPRHGGEPNPAIVGGFLFLIFSLAGVAVIGQWLYFAYLESGEKQATWGKQVIGIYVTDLAGNRISFGRASGRFFAKIVSGLIPLAIGYIMAGFTERKQALHDMIASCLVLRK